jgi:hypothetical protein
LLAWVLKDKLITLEVFGVGHHSTHHIREVIIIDFFFLLMVSDPTIFVLYALDVVFSFSLSLSSYLKIVGFASPCV